MSRNNAPMRADLCSVSFQVCVFFAANRGDWLTLDDICVNTGSVPMSAARSMRHAIKLGLVRLEKHPQHGRIYHAGPALLKMAGRVA